MRKGKGFTLVELLIVVVVLAVLAAVVVPQLPVDLRFTGVIQSRGETQAFVQIGGASGALCLGPQGRCAAGNAEALLLPSGWSVSAIDAANGVLALSFGSERRVLQLSR